MTKKFKNTERFNEAELDNVNGGWTWLVKAGKYVVQTVAGYALDKAVEKVTPYVKNINPRDLDPRKAIPNVINAIDKRISPSPLDHMPPMAMTTPNSGFPPHVRTIANL